MRRFLFAAKTTLAVLLLAGVAQATEIKVISSDGVATVLDAVKPKYEQSTGNILVIHYGAANLLKKDIMEGEAFDLAILTGEVMDAMVQSGKVVPATRVNIARAGFGIAYKAGLPQPNIHDADSFKAAMLAANSISYMAEGASGVYFTSLYGKLGIGDQVKAKAQVLGSGRVVEAVAEGKAELGVQVISNILSVAGVQMIPFPPDLQKFISFTGAVGTASNQPEVAAALLKFMTDPQNAPLIKAKGMEPG
jgi:molybdate transport system substrate-binding protein